MQRQSHAELLRSASRTNIPVLSTQPRKRFSLWKFTCVVCTLLIPSFVLSCFGMKTASIRKAWREKVALCTCILLACLGLALLTYGMNTIICRGDGKLTFGKLTDFDDPVIVAKGGVFKLEDKHRNYNILSEYSSKGTIKNLTSCFKVNSDACKRCFNSQARGRGVASLGDEKNLSRIGNVFFSWNDVTNNDFIVVGGKVYDCDDNTEPFYSELIDSCKGKDGTSMFTKLDKDQQECFKATFYAGDLYTKSYGCLMADFLLYLSTVAIFGLILTRFILATVYAWYTKKRTRRLARVDSTSFCILLVTCYSEDIEGLKGTLDSLCMQDHSEKLIFVVCDGMVKGHGNERATPELVLSLMNVENESSPMDYLALATGSKKYNRATVYTGTYSVETTTARIIVVAKIGAIGEVSLGNRGKRDSQVILLGFFSRLIHRDRMTPLDFEIYRAIRCSTHLDPSLCEYLLMVDADTVVHSNAVSHFARAFDADPKIMGMCGETKISNKTESWVTMIQVFEYYISHHLAKSFESLFGGVTCLPGCFCMYRIQVFKPRNDKYECMPLVVNPFIVQEYSLCETESLHQKNLLLLGEDRYLTTLLLKTFYKHKLIFLPAALCETQVPSSFRVLLSQRRRWINSTIHNLFELVMVEKLCGTFCCSMQFVVLLELFGTLVLPAAIVFTFVLVIVAIVSTPAWIPLIMLAGILGLPAVLILLTTREISYIFWILVYIVSLPIWNFVLPTYAFWHFDDFTWGETRKVEGQDSHDLENADEMQKCVKLRELGDVYPEVENNIVVEDYTEI